MNKITTKVASRAAVAAALSLGMTVGAVGASPVSHHRVSHSGHKWNQSQSRIEGVVSSYLAGTSISILSPGSTTPTTYALTSATTTPVTVTTINVEAPKPVRIEAAPYRAPSGESVNRDYTRRLIAARVEQSLGRARASLRQSWFKK